LKYIFLSSVLLAAGCSGLTAIDPPENFFKVGSFTSDSGVLIENGFLDEAQTRPVQHQVFPGGKEKWIEITDLQGLEVLRSVGSMTGYGGLADGLVGAVLGLGTLFAGRKGLKIYKEKKAA